MAEQSITVSQGSVLVDQSVIPYIRASEVEFVAHNLRPFSEAYFYFDDVNVNRFVQKTSTLTLNTSSSVHNIGDGLFCNTTCGYGTVVGTSPNNTIYLNENFISVNVSRVGTNTFTDTEYLKGDIIFQAAGSQTPNAIVANTFSGRVEYWSKFTGNNSGVLIISPISGTLLSNSNASNSDCFLFRLDSERANICQASVVNSGERFQNSSRVFNITRYPTTTYYTASSNAYTHTSGVIAQPNTQYAAANVVKLQGAVTSNMVGNLFFVSAGTGIGQVARIGDVDVPNNLIILEGAGLNPYIDGTSYYSIGKCEVDQNGILAGIFNLPETPTVKFKTGERLFTITDSSIINDPDASMKATAKYLASGYLQTSQEIRFTPVVASVVNLPAQTPSITPPSPTQRDFTPNPVTVVDTTETSVPQNQFDISTINWTNFGIDWGHDPVAQTFFTPKPKSVKQNYGIFVSSVDLWFKTKPNVASSALALPVTVRIVKTENGYPTKQIIASATVQCVDVKVVADTDENVQSTENISNAAYVAANKTKFVFKDPVYLSPSTEYAVVVYSESPDYEVWVSEIGGVDKTSGDQNKRVSQQPYAGSFFRSQNASTWTPYQNQDLMFIINKAVFSTSPVTLDFKVDPTDKTLLADDVLLHSSDLTFPTTTMSYSAKFINADPDTSSFVIDESATPLNPEKLYKFGQDLKLSSKTSNRRRFVLAGNSAPIQLSVQMKTNDPDVSPIFNSERLSAMVGTNVINNGGITPHQVSILSSANVILKLEEIYTAPYVNANSIITVLDSYLQNVNVVISEPQLSDGVQATANISRQLVEYQTYGDDVIGTGFITGIRITNPGSGYVESPTITITEGANTLATAVVVGEDQKFGGNAVARYQTRKITLADGFDAGDLRVYISTIRPSGTHVVAYYKVLSGSDPDSFNDKNWKRMSLVKDYYSPDQATKIELQFAPSLINDLPSGQLQYTENNVTYPLGGNFKHFAIKLVMLANDPTVIPVVYNMRAIALPAG